MAHATPATVEAVRQPQSGSEPTPARPVGGGSVVVPASAGVVRAKAGDAALAGGAAGVVAGVASGRPWGWLLMPLLAGLFGVAAVALVWRRVNVRLSDDGLRIGRLVSTTNVRWSEVTAVGVVTSGAGRSGRQWTVALLLVGDDDVATIPALSVRTPLIHRLGDEGQERRVAADVGRLLDPLLPFTARHQFAVTGGDPRD